MGVCGKTPHVAALQDLLVWVTKGLSAVTTQMRREDLNVTGEINQLITKISSQRLQMPILIPNDHFPD